VQIIYPTIALLLFAISAGWNYQISPPSISPYLPIYKWRLQQEHEMKAKNNGQGMTDEQVKM
jgi:hypothetical protein